jgi:hypothetical protein
MSVNSRWSIDGRKTKRYGGLWATIDFERFDNVPEQELAENYRNAVVGRFIIGSQEFAVTPAELSKIIETCHEAQETVMKAYKLGMFNQRLTKD